MYAGVVIFMCDSRQLPDELNVVLSLLISGSKLPADIVCCIVTKRWKGVNSISIFTSKIGMLIFFLYECLRVCGSLKWWEGLFFSHLGPAMWVFSYKFPLGIFVGRRHQFKVFECQYLWTWHITIKTWRKNNLINHNIIM